MTETEAVTVDQFVRRLANLSIEECYRWFAFDYASEIAHGDDPSGSDFARKRFLKLFAWKNSPKTEIVRRLFNQTNTYYAERHFEENPLSDPTEMVMAGNRLCLFQQGKSEGFRKRNISFGFRVHLEPRDPFRGAKWLHGVAANLVPSTIHEWAKTVNHCQANQDLALALMLALIAIHPFSDANGRVGRLIYTWLCRRWRLPILWLAEAGDGELLRTGQGIHSTEYLMAMFMIKLASQRNVVDPSGWRAPNEENDMFDALSHELLKIRTGNFDILQSIEFRELKAHLSADRHFRETSPRFECLREAIF